MQVSLSNPSLKVASHAPREWRSTSSLQSGSEQSGPSLDSSLPEKVFAQIQAFDLDSLEKRDPHLARYAKKTIDDLLANRPPDQATLDLDVQHLPLLIETENAKHPGLRLSYASNPKGLAAILSTAEPIRFRALVRLMGARHHCLADIDHGGDEYPSSIVVFESAKESYHEFFRNAIDRVSSQPLDAIGRTAIFVDPPNADFEGLANTVQSFKETLEQNAVVGKVLLQQKPEIYGVLNTIQRSHFDCVMFSLYNAAKSHQIGFADTVRANQEDANTQTIPPIFLKHAHSESTLRPGSEDAASDDLAAKVQLHDRQRALQVRRISCDEPKRYSLSIEAFRLKKIFQAAQYLQYKELLANGELGSASSFREYLTHQKRTRIASGSGYAPD